MTRMYDVYIFCIRIDKVSSMKKCLDNKITFLFVDLKTFEEIQNRYPVYM